MKDIKRKWDRLNETERKTAIEEIINFFSTERDEEIGIIAAEEVLDFFLQNIGNKIYNKGIENAKFALEQRVEDLKVDFDLLLD